MKVRIKYPHTFQPLLESDPNQGTIFMYCVHCGIKYAKEMPAPLEECPAFERFIIYEKGDKEAK